MKYDNSVGITLLEDNGLKKHNKAEILQELEQKIGERWLQNLYEQLHRCSNHYGLHVGYYKSSME